MWSYGFCVLIFAAVFGVMDFVWLTKAFTTIYQPAIGPMLAEKVRLGPAAIFYLIYVAGAAFFVVMPAVPTGDWGRAALRGAAFGLVAYATYDLTNQATLSVWPTRLTLVDMGWGAFATAVSSTVTVVCGGRALKLLGWS